LHSFSGVSHIPCSITITGFPAWAIVDGVGLSGSGLVSVSVGGA
jgi:hypothetical protein